MFRFQNKISFFFLLPRKPGSYNFRSVCHGFGRQADRGRYQAGSYHGAPGGKAQACSRAAEAHVPRCRKGQPAGCARGGPATSLQSRSAGWRISRTRARCPTIFRLYSLCAIYRLNLEQVLGWYGIPVELLPAESLQTPLNETHAVEFAPAAKFTVPLPADSEVDLNSTTFLSHVIRRWGKTGISLLNGWDLRQHRYGFIGLEDWSMYPVLRPGSLVLIDESRRRIEVDGWTSEMNRPIYFLEHRDGYRCGWCTPYDNHILVQPHPSSHRKPDMYGVGEIDVIGQVTGVAMLLEPSKRRRARSAAVPAASPNP